MKILMQNRPNAFTHRGGDTALMEFLAKELISLGVGVDIDVSAQADLAPYDLVHLYNFATPEFTEFVAKRAAQAGRKFVVTTLYEDWPLFFNQMHHAFDLLEKYVQVGQPREKWPEFLATMKHCTPSRRLENSWVAANASRLLVTGEIEAASLRRDYGPGVPISCCHVGCDVSAQLASAELFTQKTGLNDFVLCVGRIEPRKNQLMLLKALEDSELTLVFAGGGFTYQPDYVTAAKNFRRRGKTVFLDRLEPEMLASMYAAAKVHALPSWYELPGMVSLEAARYGAQVVVSDFGTARDYFGDDAFYAAPDNPVDILNAVMAAYYQPRNNRLQKRAAEFTWARSARETLVIYEQVLQ